MTFRKEPPKPPGEDWENSLFVHAKRFPVKKALKLAQSLDFGFFTPQLLPLESEAVLDESSSPNLLALPEVPEIEPFCLDSEVSEPVAQAPSFSEVLEAYQPDVLESPESIAPMMPPHVAQMPVAKKEERPTASPLPPVGHCFETDREEAPPTLGVAPPVPPLDNDDDAFEGFLRQLLEAAKATQVQSSSPGSVASGGVQPPFYGVPVWMPQGMVHPLVSPPAGTLVPVSLYPVSSGEAPVAFAVSESQAVSVPLKEPEVVLTEASVPELADNVEDAAPQKTVCPSVVVPLMDLNTGVEPVFRTQVVEMAHQPHVDNVIALTDYFQMAGFQETPVTFESEGESAADGGSEPILSVVPDLEPETASGEMGTVIPFRRDAVDDVLQEPASEDIAPSEDTVVPFPLRPEATVEEAVFEPEVVDEETPMPPALEGFSLEFPDFSWEDSAEETAGQESALASTIDLSPSSLGFSEAQEDDVFSLDTPWPEETFVAEHSTPEVFTFDEWILPDADEALAVPSNTPLEPQDTVAPEDEPEVLTDLLGDFSQQIELEVPDEASPEDALEILASATLGDEFEMLLVHLEGLYALMVDNGENAVLLKTFDQNPLVSDEPIFMVSEEAELETGKLMYLAHVGDWQGIVSIEGDDAKIQAELPWGDP